jgi:hypothetical protein
MKEWCNTANGCTIQRTGGHAATTASVLLPTNTAMLLAAWLPMRLVSVQEGKFILEKANIIKVRAGAVP